VTLRDYRSITEPERIRALAHPTRLELLDYLQEAGEATATECAHHIGESVASCSFHLRMLGKYGYIEPAERRGREKPWRVAHGTRDIRPAPEVSGSLSAVAELAALVVLHEGERFRRFLSQAHDEADEWIQASTVASADFWVTPEELAELSRRIHHLADEYLVRNTDPAQRPAGARRARLFAALNPDPVDPEETTRG
jgi:DNA-binding transcriptional ArsR family regulator